MRPHHLSLLGLLAGAAPLAAQVRPGIEVLLADSVHLVAGKRVALLTNQTGVDRQGRRDVDLVRSLPGVRLVLLFSPEHGIRGTEDRPGLPDGVDSATGLPIYSLYGGTPLSDVAALDSTDVVLVDLQDIGARYYSYTTVAVSLMQEATRRGKPVVVLDRPDPIGGEALQGSAPATLGRMADFLAVPMRHGMTLGEMLRMANAVHAIHADLTVVPAAGWRRAQYYDETGLPWVKPSPNMPDLESAIHYPGTCLFEATNLSVGRGTDLAFQVIGAPWLDPATVLARLGPATGVAIDTITFTPSHPTDGKYDGVALRGIRLRVTDRRRYDPAATAVALLAALRATQRDSLRFNATRFDQLAAGSELRHAILAGRSAALIARGWRPALARFQRARAKYLLY